MDIKKVKVMNSLNSLIKNSEAVHKKYLIEYFQFSSWNTIAIKN